MIKNTIVLFSFLICLPWTVNAQQADASILTVDRLYSGEFAQASFGPSKWLNDGEAYTTLEASLTEGAKDIVQYDTKSGRRTILVDATALTPADSDTPLTIANYSWSNDGQKLMVFTNTKRVWRTNTKGDYWIYDLSTKTLMQVGATLPTSSLMFAKFSTDDEQIAFVSENNLYVQNLSLIHI